MIHPYIYVGTFNKFVPTGKINKEEILRIVCNELEMEFEEVKNHKTRLREFVYARQLYGYFCKIYTKESLSSIGKFINKDHATILHSVKQINNFKDVDKKIKNEVNKINSILKNKVFDTNADQRERISDEIILKYKT